MSTNTDKGGLPPQGRCKEMEHIVDTKKRMEETLVSHHYQMSGLKKVSSFSDGRFWVVSNRVKTKEVTVASNLEVINIRLGKLKKLAIERGEWK